MYTTIQDALDALPSILDDSYTIKIYDGSYDENIVYPEIEAGIHKTLITAASGNSPHVQRFGKIRSDYVTISKLNFSLEPDEPYTIRGLSIYKGLVIEKNIFSISNDYIIENHNEEFFLPLTTDQTVRSSITGSRLNTKGRLWNAITDGLEHLVVRNNIFHHNGSDTSIHSDKDVYFRQNTIYIPTVGLNGVIELCDNATVENNIFYVTGSGNFQMTKFTNGIWKTNIWYVPNGIPYWVIDSRDFLWWKTNIGTLDYAIDPGLLDPGNNDFHLTMLSNAVDIGINTGILDDIEDTARPQNLGYDIGAYELPSFQPMLCWEYKARYRYGKRIYRIGGPGPFPTSLRVPSNVDISTGIMIDEGFLIDSSRYQIVQD
jgi:hypothetical protein